MSNLAETTRRRTPTASGGGSGDPLDPRDLRTLTRAARALRRELARRPEGLECPLSTRLRGSEHAGCSHGSGELGSRLVLLLDRLLAAADDATEPVRPDPLPVGSGRDRVSRLPRTRENGSPLDGPATDADRPRGAYRPGQRFLERVRSFVEANLEDEDLDVGTLARSLALSRVHLYRRLRAAGGPPPSELILEARLQRAGKLLLSSDATVSEITYDVGFKSVSHFSRRFRRRFGVPPSEYRTRSWERSSGASPEGTADRLPPEGLVSERPADIARF